MTYIELINEFWLEYESKGMKPNDVLLYFYLLKECNRNSWRNPLAIPTKRISTYLEMTNKTIIDSRTRLVERGLITVQKGDRNKDCPIYFLVSVGNQNGTKTEPKRNQNGTNYNNIEYKTKTKTKESDSAPAQTSLFKENEIEGRKTASKQSTGWLPPTLDEVVNYFKTHSHGLPNWEALAERFYNHFTGYGWIGSNNRKINRWDSIANKWIGDELEKLKSNVTTPKTIGSTPSSGVPIRGKVTPSCGLKRRNAQGED